MAILAKEDHATAPPVAKKVNFVLTERGYNDLLSLSKETMKSMTELLRLGLGLVRIAIEAEKRGQRLIVTSDEGEPIKEILLPS